MNSCRHLVAAVRTVLNARDCNSAVMYAAKLIARNVKRARCPLCGTRMLQTKTEQHVKD